MRSAAKARSWTPELNNAGVWAAMVLKYGPALLALAIKAQPATSRTDSIVEASATQVRRPP